MLSIGIVTDDSVRADWRVISQRLRGATIAESVAAAQGNKPPEACEAVVFVGSQPLKKDVIERTLSGGGHVLLATDPCLSSEDLESLSGVAKNRGLQFAVVNPDRFLPSRQLIKQHIESKFGDVGLVRVHRWEPIQAECPVAPLGLPGPLVRDLELVMWLTGETPQVVYALERPANESSLPGGHYMQIHLGFSRGMALVDYSDHLPAGDGYHSVSVIGSTGAACADDQQNMQLLYSGGAPQGLRTREGTMHLAAIIQEFVDGVAGQKDLSATVTAWRSVLAVVDAVRQSLATRRAIHWKGA